MPRRKPRDAQRDDTLGQLKPLELPAPGSPDEDVRLAGRVRSLGAEFVAVLALPPDVRHLVVRRPDIKAARRIDDGGDEDDPVFELTVAGGAPAFLAAATYVGTAVALTRVTAPTTSAPQIPFVLATPHHVGVAYNPASLGGNVPLPQATYAYGAPTLAQLLATPVTLAEGFADEREKRTTFQNDRITLPEGPVGPPNVTPDPPRPAPPKGTDFTNDRITLPEGPVGPPSQTDAFFDALQPPDPPPPAPKGTDLISDRITLPEGPVGSTTPLVLTNTFLDALQPPSGTDPFLPPAPQKPLLDDLIFPQLRRITFTFGDRFSLDYRFDF